MKLESLVLFAVASFVGVLAAAPYASRYAEGRRDSDSRVGVGLNKRICVKDGWFRVRCAASSAFRIIFRVSWTSVWCRPTVRGLIGSSEYFIMYTMEGRC